MNKQAGFTLIEIIAVIVILGILSAVALPKFVNLGGEARIAKMNGAAGAINSAAVLIHSKWLAMGSPAAGTLSYEGGTLTVASEMVNGYPGVGKIDDVAGLGANDFNFPAATATTMTVAADSTHAACAVTYTVPAALGDAPVVDTATGLTDANCK